MALPVHVRVRVDEEVAELRTLLGRNKGVSSTCNTFSANYSCKRHAATTLPFPRGNRHT